MRHSGFSFKPINFKTAFVGLVSLTLLAGCAEGPFWRTGKLSPWAREKWIQEERIADTLFERKRNMNEAVAAVASLPASQQETVAAELQDNIRRDPVLLLRLHSVKLLGDLNCPTAKQALIDASSDPEPEVRIAAVSSWEKMAPELAIRQLQEIIGSDTNTDVRLAATRALGNFTGERAVQALSLALTDNNPAIQLRATESLDRVTGESIGANVSAWQQYVQQMGIQSGAPSFTTSPASRVAKDANDLDSNQFR